MTKPNDILKSIFTFVKTKFSKISADTLGWISNVCLHAATIPSLVALMSGLTDRPPSVDVVLMVWAALSDRKSTRLNSSHSQQSRMPSSA